MARKQNIMKKLLPPSILIGIALLICNGLQAQQEWPKTVITADGVVIRVYQPQPDSFSRNVLTFRSAVSVLEKNVGDPVFGTMWSRATVEIDRDDRQLTIGALTIPTLKIPGDSNITRIDYLRAALEAKLPAAIGQIPLDEILTSLQQNIDERNLSKGISTLAPKIIYVMAPSVLVTIDGLPRLQENKKWGLEAVVNSPFTIVQDKNKIFYLYGGGRWYSAPSLTGPYTYIQRGLSARLRRIERAYRRANPDRNQQTKAAATADSVIPMVVVSTTPAELIQTSGNPEFVPIIGTALLYIENSPNDLFLDTNSQLYYLLLSGRWYQSKTLGDTGWTYVASDSLPADFAKIPEGSPKDNVLASVAGTKAAQEAIMDAQLPQTAKVDRKKATTHVTYDGAPKFLPVDGTNLQYAVNTASTVLLYQGRYYAVDNGIWFVSNNALGPWTASETRPDGLDGIAPSSPVYNTKFVDIYDVTPDYIYTGYSAGYLDNYIYGATVVYGTGFYYNPWIGSYYYPRPWSWGFGVIYDPWYGWGFGAGFGFDWFNIGFGFGWGGWYGGWWGPGFYHPACWGYGRGYRPQSFYGRNLAMAGHVGVHTRNNVYRGRSGVVAGEHSQFARGSYNAAGRRLTDNRSGERPGNETVSDRSGNVFQRQGNGDWQSKSSPADNDHSSIDRSSLDRIQEMRDRGLSRTQNFQQARAFSGGGFGGFRGGGFRGGGGGRR
jgi:hypothetical protein